jgi:hypothetical protein
VTVGERILTSPILVRLGDIHPHTMSTLSVDVLKVSQRLQFILGGRRFEPSEALGIAAR